MVNKVKNLAGLTLTEVLVYLALFGIFFLVMVQTVLYIQTLNHRTNAKLKLDRSLIFVTQHMDTNVLVSDSIDADVGSGGNSEFGVDDGVLYTNEGSAYHEYSIVANRLSYDNNGASTSELTRADTNIDAFNLVEVLDDSSNIIGVQATITLSSKRYSDISKTATVSLLLN